jgi:hypothetical protein
VWQCIARGWQGRWMLLWMSWWMWSIDFILWFELWVGEFDGVFSRIFGKFVYRCFVILQSVMQYSVSRLRIDLSWSV